MSETDNYNLHARWPEITASLSTLAEVDGGLTAAHRGIVTLADDEQVFVKIGIDAETKVWANNELHLYAFLQRHGYPFAPEVLATNEDETGFALDALSSENGWDWSDNWTEDRLTKTLEAMDALAKLRTSGRDDITSTLNIGAMAEQSARFTFGNDTLVHNDVRGDNCAWNPQLQTVKLVDWNWAGMGNRDIDVGALLVAVQKSGLDVAIHHADRLNSEALYWLVGFWLKSAVTPVSEGGRDHIYDFQLQSGIVALDLANKVSSQS